MMLMSTPQVMCAYAPAGKGSIMALRLKLSTDPSGEIKLTRARLADLIKEKDILWRNLIDEIDHFTQERNQRIKLQDKLMEVTKEKMELEQENVALKEHIHILSDPTNRKNRVHSLSG